jgi:hypothetical protein
MERIAGMTVVPLPTEPNKIVMSVITSASLLLKTYTADGTKTAAANMYSGCFETLGFSSLSELQAKIRTLTNKQCLCLGVVHGTWVGEITTTANQHLHPNAVTRSKKHFRWSCDVVEGYYSVLFIDYDFSELLPKHLKARTFEEIRALLIKAIPALAFCHLLIRWSSSSNIIKEDGTPLHENTSMHLFFIVKNATDANMTDFMEYLDRSLWANDLAFVMVTKGDQIVSRSFIDKSVLSPERIIISNTPIMPMGWQKLREDEFALYDGGALNLEGIDYSHLPEYLPAFWDAKHALEATIERTPRKSGAYIKREALPASFTIGASLQDKLLNIQNKLNKGGETVSVKQLLSMIDGEVTRYLLQGIGYSVDQNYKFKIREERTSSASIRFDGLINDFGGDFGGNIINFMIDICGLSFKTSNKYVRIALGATPIRLKPSDYEPLIDPKKIKNYPIKDL